MPTALITGTTGLIGGHLAAALADQFDVVALNRTAAPAAAGSFAWDLHSDLPNGLPSKVDLVIHTAATNGRDASEPDRECFAVNTQATARLLQYAARAGARQFVFCSTGSVYPARIESVDEDTPIAPAGHYAATKAAAEALVAGYATQMKVLTLRLFYPYAADQRQQRLIPGILERIRAGRPVRLNGPEGRPVINPVHVNDVVQWIQRLLGGEASGVYNLAGAETLSIRELAERLATLLEKAVDFEIGPAIAGNCLGSIERVVAATGYRPRISLTEGLAEMTSGQSSPPSGAQVVGVQPSEAAHG